ncbi:MAG TPA: UDP-N-acetylmuramoylalanyl-D-glutamyl-2,6-diaminopimelate--D-alanyl-D-alanine ligase [Aliidongia sp.]|uniref:UDP-N-acetylmuramoylalanyl-D-glutamyl-2, 6-diaminopimelate--D-alanyl-D-alanine ligase n=1 Tax=Aliidongia sp. TaxID=1914230 RepID=UPI002DDD9D1F|nr:UDP-N-acetylmuramoylalanyl-D-glutamyl-2,6-diaminopimelate--D-alanyl-D-alanine ligase [Aliidongia sp.]HEV2676708.1 UDP-N-acetylmuramoylalanyl-D-glutamyl-2,6-diaminopimelate--D-alanyl-D-alanine ligase [Aliidongia sp.]
MTARIPPLWTPAELAEAVRGAASGRAPESIPGISIDSRTVAAGEAFLALVGPNFDGHDYVAKALAQGAGLAIVAHRPADVAEDASLVLVDDTQSALERLGAVARARARATARIVAVTGSVGKTSTKEALAHCLVPQGRTHWATGSFNNQWGVPLSLGRMPRDTQYGVFEVGMNHAGEIRALTAQVRPDVAIVTTIEPVHLEYFSGIEAIADAKAEIFEGMAPGAVAILNRDTPMFGRLADAARAHGLQIVSFGEQAQADARLVSVALGAEASEVEAVIAGRRIAYRLGVPGKHLVLNSLAVLVAVEALGADLAQAAAALGTLAGVTGRGKWLTLTVAGGSATLIDESYNASPVSMRAAFAVLAAQRPAGRGRRIAVLGDMRELGSAGPALHEELAAPLLASGADLVFACGPLMRGLFDALPAALRGAHRDSAAELAPLVAGALGAGDVVTVKGSLGTRMADIVKPLVSGTAFLKSQSVSC